MEGSNEFKLVTMENMHLIVPKYINDNELIINGYEDMVDVILTMIREKHIFNFDKNILRSFMEDLTYMYSPGDDLNKDRIINMLEASSEEEDDEEDEETIPLINQ
tara:strand:- start:6533 stop:6847 length:315 start_codon:yes stop_codon:yes gene_type:complete